MPFFDISHQVDIRRQQRAEEKMLQEKRDRLQKKLTLSLFVFLGATAFLHFFSPKLPAVSEILPELLEEPLQTPTDHDSFSFGYRGNAYFVEPKAEYHISALVVSHNNIGSIFDSYHDSDSVDTRDFCVMWGDNLRSDIFQKISVKNSSWSCHYSADSREVWNRFDRSQLSNNHLVTDDPEVRKMIASVRIGDQIRISGFLVDYYDEEGGSRQTSLSREDTNETSRSGGACEVFFVESIEIIKRNVSLFYLLFRLFSFASVLVLAVKIFFFFQKSKYPLSFS